MMNIYFLSAGVHFNLPSILAPNDPWISVIDASARVNVSIVSIRDILGSRDL